MHLADEILLSIPAGRHSMKIDNSSILLTQYCAGDKMRRMRWAGRVARMGEERGVYMVLLGNLRERDHWADPGGDGRIVFGGVFRMWGYGMDWSGSG
jgi:hypothetical protein